MGGPLGLPHMPIENLNPCFRIRPIVMKLGPASNQSYEINAAWAATTLIHGTDGYPTVDGIFTHAVSGADLVVSSIGAAKQRPVMVQNTFSALSNKAKYPFIFRQSRPDTYCGD